jgi:hypothetical protein
MLSFLVKIVLPVIIVIPMAIGFTLSLLILILYPLFVRLRLQHHTRTGIAMSLGLIATLLVMSLYAWQMISITYKSTFPASPGWEIRQTYEHEAILGAWRSTIIPPPFPRSCSSGEEIVCQLAEQYSLGIWDGRIDAEDLPWLPGLISGITCVMMVRWIFSAIIREINSASAHSRL